MQGGLSYLFRRAGGHVFLCAADPEARYESACGSCGYPVLENQHRCPRCRQELEECPCCSALRHLRPVKAIFDSATETRTCPSCNVRRAPFGRRRLSELQGTFCTNIYGCPVGGLLLSTGEFALLPPHASRCPLCEHATLKPLAVQSFAKLVERCWFCRHCFGSTGSTGHQWRDSAVAERPTPGEPQAVDPCVLCGRRDYRVKGRQQTGKDGERLAAAADDAAADEESATVAVLLYDSPAVERSLDDYRAMVAAARALVRRFSDAAAQAAIFQIANFERDALSRILGDWIGGTHDPVIRRILEARTRHLVVNLDRLYGREAARFED